MTPDQADDLECRWQTAHRELESLAELRVANRNDDPVAREGALQQELDEIEYEFGIDYFKALRFGRGFGHTPKPIGRDCAE